MQTHFLLRDVTSAGPGYPVKIDPFRTHEGGPIPIVLTGVVTATVTLEATLSDIQEITEGTAEWAPIANATWTEDIADGLFTGFSFIRANVVQYTAGSITLKALL